jgi:hypothetical protein
MILGISKVCRKLEVSVQFLSFGTAAMALKVIKAPTVRFNNGIEFPIFGLGTWKVSQLFSASILRIVM